MTYQFFKRNAFRTWSNRTSLPCVKIPLRGADNTGCRNHLKGIFISLYQNGIDIWSKYKLNTFFGYFLRVQKVQIWLQLQIWMLVYWNLFFRSGLTSCQNTIRTRFLTFQGTESSDGNYSSQLKNFELIFFLFKVMTYIQALIKWKIEMPMLEMYCLYICVLSSNCRQILFIQTSVPVLYSARVLFFPIFL